MREYFKNNRIAIIFRSKEEHRKILDYFENCDSLTWNCGTCSFFTWTEKSGLCTITHGYQCSSLKTLWDSLYIKINFEEFEFLTSDERRLIELI